MKYLAAKGNFWQNYIGEVGEWVEVSKLKYYWFKLKGYKVKKMIPEIDKEWSKFLENCPETTLPIKLEASLYEKAKNKWYVKMSIKYGFSVNELNKKYGYV